MQPEFKTYAAQVVKNARVLAQTLLEAGFEIVSGGTDNHLMLVDVRAANITGDQAEKVIELANLTCNKNPLPGDPVNPMKWRGVRLGVAAATTRGMKEAEMAEIGRLLSRIWVAADGYELDEETRVGVKTAVSTLCNRFPTYPLP